MWSDVVLILKVPLVFTVYGLGLGTGMFVRQRSGSVALPFGLRVGDGAVAVEWENLVAAVVVVVADGEGGKRRERLLTFDSGYNLRWMVVERRYSRGASNL